MPKQSQAAPSVVHFEAHPKAVKRALKAVQHGLEVVECRASDNNAGEHGKTTLVYSHAGDAGEQRLDLDAVSKQTNIEQDHLLRDDPEEDA